MQMHPSNSNVMRVVEIVYDKDHSVGPNGKGEVSLPKYIVVDFPTYKPPPGEDPWDKNNPTVSKSWHMKGA